MVPGKARRKNLSGRGCGLLRGGELGVGPSYQFGQGGPGAPERQYARHCHQCETNQRGADPQPTASRSGVGGEASGRSRPAGGISRSVYPVGMDGIGNVLDADFAKIFDGMLQSVAYMVIDRARDGDATGRGSRL